MGIPNIHLYIKFENNSSSNNNDNYNNVVIKLQKGGYNLSRYSTFDGTHAGPRQKNEDDHGLDDDDHGLSEDASPGKCRPKFEKILKNLENFVKIWKILD